LEATTLRFDIADIFNLQERSILAGDFIAWY
jgi:hypothetical protein